MKIEAILQLWRILLIFVLVVDLSYLFKPEAA